MRLLYNADHWLFTCCGLTHCCDSYGWLRRHQFIRRFIEEQWVVDFVSLKVRISAILPNAKQLPPRGRQSSCSSKSFRTTGCQPHSDHYHEVKDKVLASIRLAAVLQRKVAETTIQAHSWAPVHRIPLLFCPILVFYAVYLGSGPHTLNHQVAFFSIFPDRSSSLPGRSCIRGPFWLAMSDRCEGSAGSFALSRSCMVLYPHAWKRSEILLFRSNSVLLRIVAGYQCACLPTICRTLPVE